LFGAFTGGTETTESVWVGGEVLLVLALELLDEVVYEPVVKVLATHVGVTGGGLDLEDTLLNGQEEVSRVPPSRSKARTLRSSTVFLPRL